MNMHRASF